ncbi:FtsX-like permease family protein [Lachnospiraceae bacterium NE2001]|nr:FtsX-like permease family protein [Lachnospiraceae bacterium NE2001]
MEDYRELGNKYLKQNRRRSLLTVLGCMIVAAVLFAFMNSACDGIDWAREEARKEGDYEIVILSDDKDSLEKIVNEDFVRSAYIGKEYDYDAEKEYANALHINVNNVLFVRKYNSYIQETYNVDTKLNVKVLWTYCMDGEGLGFLIIAGGLFIAYIFAIVGIGIIRNSIQISALERIKDYGNLRCIGATKRQIKSIVFRESFVLESIGIAGGVLLGFIISVPVAVSLDFPVGFHFIPVFLILIAFNFDLYFAIGDGVKKVLSVSPVEAVKGSYRIRNRKLRRRRSGIWGKIFGVEGDYAYKNIRRNTGRFLKTTGAMAFGLGTVVVIGSVMVLFIRSIESTNKEYGYYQQYIQAYTMSTDSMDELKSQLNSPESLEKIKSASGVEDLKYVYHDTIYTSENSWLRDHLDENYLVMADYAYYNFYRPFLTFEDRYGKEKWDDANNDFRDNLKSYRDSGKGLVDYDELNVNRDDRTDIKGEVVFFGSNLIDSSFDIYGYDAEDYARYKDRLIDGTTELSENGILLINQSYQPVSQAYNQDQDNADYLYILADKKNFTMTTLKVGDEITIVDPVELDKLVQEEMKKAKEYDSIHENDDDYAKITDNFSKSSWIIESARDKLVEEGKTKTYVVEGILESDPNRNNVAPTIIVPLDRYFEITGQTENDYTGFQFHISNPFSPDIVKSSFQDAVFEPYYRNSEAGDEYLYGDAEISHFFLEIQDITYFMKILGIMGGVILIIVLVSAFNTMNTSISNLQLRRNEFAQLRALGMTKNSLLKAVLLEGGIVWIISSILGMIGGLMVGYFMHEELIRYIVYADYYIAWIPIIIAALLELLVLCGTNYVVIRDMRMDIATELTRSGE